MILSQALNDFYQYWQSIREEDEIIPSRDKFNPMAISKLLPDIIILDQKYVNETAEFIVRLAGTNFYDRYGFEISGKNFLNFFPKKVQQNSLKALNLVIEHPAGLLRHISTPLQYGYFQEEHSLLLPLKKKNCYSLIIISNDASKFINNLSKIPIGKIERVSSRNWIDIGKGCPKEPH